MCASRTCWVSWWTRDFWKTGWCQPKLLTGQPRLLWTESSRSRNALPQRESCIHLMTSKNENCSSYHLSAPHVPRRRYIHLQVSALTTPCLALFEPRIPNNPEPSTGSMLVLASVPLSIHSSIQQTYLLCVAYGLNCVPPAFICWSLNTWYLRAWSYLEIQSLQV